MPLPLIAFAVSVVTLFTGALLQRDRLEYKAPLEEKTEVSSGDRDRDGFADWKEYLAGTDPNSASSHPEIPRLILPFEKKYEPPVTGGPQYSVERAFQERAYGSAGATGEQERFARLSDVKILSGTSGAFAAVFLGENLNLVSRVSVTYGVGPEKKEFYRQFIYKFKNQNANKIEVSLPPIPEDIDPSFIDQGVYIIGAHIISNEIAGEEFPLSFMVVSPK